MKVIHIPRRFTRSDWGGTETAVLELSKRTLAAGHDARILCPNALADEDSEIIDGVSVQRYPYFYPYIGLRNGARLQMDRKGGNLFSFPLMRALEQLTGARLGNLVVGA